jgi:hypothetical protein
LWDVFIINSVEQLQTLPKTQSEIDISPFLKTQKPSSRLYSIVEEGFCVFRNGLISIRHLFHSKNICPLLFLTSR